MKKLLYPFLIISSLFLNSCGEDETPEGPPVEVSEIDVAVIEGTLVRISWQESQDPNGDDVHYDVVVNNLLVTSNATGNFLEYDITPLLPVARNAEAKKGVSIILTVKMKAYDTNNNVSNITEVNRNIYVNRSPKPFQFDNIYMDTSSYNYMEIVWNPAQDDDGDTLSYDIYINEDLLEGNFVIGSNTYDGLGRIQFYQSFYEYINDEIIIKVVAKDSSGGTSEITKSFSFRATDINLGELNLPYENNHTFSISANEPDNKVGYRFSTTESTGLSISSPNQGNYYYLMDINGNHISSGYDRLYIESLPAGEHYIEIEGYSNYSGNFTLSLRDAKATDIDLGELSVPYSNLFNIDSTNEPDNKIGYKFSIIESSGLYIQQNNSYNSYYLKDSNGNDIYSGYDKLFVDNLPQGNYTLEVENNQNTGTNFTLNIADATLTDENLGELEVPFEQFYEFTISNDELDNKIVYYFSITENTGLSLISQTNNNNTFTLKDSNGNYLYNGYDRMLIGSIPAGSYSIEIENYYSNNASGNFTLFLRDAESTDLDLGLITTLPFSSSYSLSALNNEPDSYILYKFEVNESVNFSFNTSQNSYVYLLDSNKNYISGDYSNHSGSLNSGVYYVRVESSGNVTNGTLSISFD